ncbi:MAG: response regulator [Candidatus Eisenbacteria bacterium]|uniref:Response regulator n=1 Tax=Eiseniibacteriota bacterium TaxID=2212470 RepID=A0A538SC74_UNCEI|nr:MAG: response regulator [Candidatus Eisenbacteria bacterium]
MSELKRVLLAEDSAKDVELTLAALQDSHLVNEVVVARDGAEAWEYLSCTGAHANRPPVAPAVVLLDLKMPKLDGHEVLRRMRADPNLRTVPVVILTSSREERDIAQSYDFGVNAYVVKPVAFSEFISAVKNLGMFWAVLNEPPPASARKAA